jgi:hypothetical protein
MWTLLNLNSLYLSIIINYLHNGFPIFCHRVDSRNNYLSGEEFLRRFCMHILPHRFVKIRYYGILGSRYKKEVQPFKDKPDLTKAVETHQERVIRLRVLILAVVHAAKPEP